MIKDAKSYHCDLYKAIWRHDMRWLQLLVDDYVRGNNILTKIFLKVLANMIKNVADPVAVRNLNKRASEAKETALIQRKTEQNPIKPTLSNN
jgi:hypothetical protein